MRRKIFKESELVWISSNKSIFDLLVGRLPCAAGSCPYRILLKQGVPCVIVRQAVTTDYGEYGRHDCAVDWANMDWLVLYQGQLVLIDGLILAKRHVQVAKTMV